MIPLRFPLAVLLLGLSVLALRNRSEGSDCAPTTITERALLNVGHAAGHYRTEHEGRCPTTIGLLRARRYLISEPMDGWRGALQLRCRALVIEVRSAGRDGMLGTEDDFRSWTF